MPLVGWLTAVLSGCTEQSSMAASPPAPAPVVEVAPVITERLTDWDSFTGRLEAPQEVALRPRVSGYIEKVTFQEGEHVEKGDTLFLIDDRELKMEADRLEALLAQYTSRYDLAKRSFSRVNQLYNTRAVSKEMLDTRSAELEQASAQVLETTAALEKARLNLAFAAVRAPISGRISRAFITEGNYVSAGQSVMTTIVSTDHLHAYFDIDENTWLDYQKTQYGAEYARPVALRLSNQLDYAHWGHLDFSDNQLNATTGTMRVRAVFANDDRQLMPGLFAHLKLAGGLPHQAVLISDKAIGTDLKNKFVLVVDADNTVQYRSVTLGDKIGQLRMIKNGLEGNEDIVVTGLQQVRPGVEVQPERVVMVDEQLLSEVRAWQRRADDALIAPGSARITDIARAAP